MSYKPMSLFIENITEWSIDIHYGDPDPTDDTKAFRGIRFKTNSSGDNGCVRAATSGFLRTWSPYDQPATLDQSAVISDIPSNTPINLWLHPTPVLCSHPGYRQLLRSQWDLPNDLLGFKYDNLDKDSLYNYLKNLIFRTNPEMAPLTADDAMIWFLNGTFSIWVNSGEIIGSARVMGEGDVNFRQFDFWVMGDRGYYNPISLYYQCNLSSYIKDDEDMINEFLTVNEYDTWDVVLNDLLLPAGESLPKIRTTLYPHSVLQAVKERENPGVWLSVKEDQKGLYRNRLLRTVNKTVDPLDMSPPFEFDVDDGEWQNLAQLEAVVEFYMNFNDPYESAPLVSGVNQPKLPREQGYQSVDLSEGLHLLLIDNFGGVYFGDNATIGHPFDPATGNTTLHLDVSDRILPEGSSSKSGYFKPAQFTAFRDRYCVPNWHDIYLINANGNKIFEIVNVSAGATYVWEVEVRGNPDLSGVRSPSPWKVPAGVGGKTSIFQPQYSVRCRAPHGRHTFGPYYLGYLGPVIAASGPPSNRPIPDNYDGMLFLVFHGDILGMYPWTSFCSRYLPDGCSIRGNKKYAFRSKVSHHNRIINFALRVYEWGNLHFIDDGSTTGIGANRLIDANTHFLTSNVAVGNIVVNKKEPERYAIVTAINSDTELVLDRHIFDVNNTSYRIITGIIEIPQGGTLEDRHAFPEGQNENQRMAVWGGNNYIPNVDNLLKGRFYFRYRTNSPVIEGGKGAIFLHLSRSDYPATAVNLENHWSDEFSGSSGCLVSPFFPDLRFRLLQLRRDWINDQNWLTWDDEDIHEGWASQWQASDQDLYPWWNSTMMGALWLIRPDEKPLT